MNNKKIYKIQVFTRGKNADEYGNPYHAYKVILHFEYEGYYNKVSVSQSMSGGDSSKWDCLNWALRGVKESLGLSINPDDDRIEHHHKHVYRDSDLEHPENWKV